MANVTRAFVWRWHTSLVNCGIQGRVVELTEPLNRMQLALSGGVNTKPPSPGRVNTAPGSLVATTPLVILRLGSAILIWANAT